MGLLWPELEPLLDQVQRPARYIGGEEGARPAEHAPGKVAWLLCYPDSYEIGLPNQGLQILYEILNERADAVAERAYAPWMDLEALLRSEGLPLFSVDTHRAAADFDILAFNLSSELVYTNVLNLIDLAGVAVHAVDRTDDDLLVGAGGHCAFNPEPLADFVDFFVLGDGEEVVSEITEAVADHRAGGRREVLEALAGVEGVYVPAAYEVTFEGLSTTVTPRWPGTPETVQKRTIASLGDWPYPKQQLVPLTEVVHDRLNVEVFRGCTRGCRFCQAGMITRPVRERPAEQVRTMITEGLRRTGYDEVALTSLSTADFSGIEELVADTVGPADGAGGAGCPAISVSLPSLRVDAFTVGLAAQLQRARRTGLTFAPEAGSWRLRQVINKLISSDDLDAAVEGAYSQGWRRIKLYFLVGLPTETDEDVLGIAALARRCVELGRRHVRGASVTVSVGGFVPKPQTPFQWFGQNTVAELRRKVGLLIDDLRHDRGVKLKWHDPEATLVEGLASRGDRRLGAVIEEVWRAGGTFQEWSEHFDFDLWLDAMGRHGLSVEDYAYRHRHGAETLPWDHLSAGLHKDFLWQDWQDALAESGLEDCRWTPCYDCGACTGYGIEHVVASAVPPAGGSQGTGQNLLQPGACARESAGRPSVGGCVVRVRLRWTKHGRIRFCSHRDSARIWERAVRRAELPVSYTQGFTPRPRFSFGLALATGQESVAEYLDVDLRLSPEEVADCVVDLPERLTAALPEGMAVTEACPLIPGAASLQEAVTSCTWEFVLAGADRTFAADWVERVRSAESLPLERERKGRSMTSDVRPAVGLLRMTDVSSGSVLVAELGTKPRAVRPAEFLRLTAPPLPAGRVRRLHQWIMRDGERYEPLASEAGVLKPAGEAPAAAGCRAVPAAQPEVCAR